MTGKMAIFDGIPLFIPNDVIEAENFYISYNDRDATTYGSDTTALVLETKTSTHFYILNGNHSEQYKKIIKNVDDCINYFQANKKDINKYSEKFTEDNRIIKLIYNYID